jgi:hypothetical protein
LLIASFRVSNIEFQMTTAAFLAAQRNALRALGLCPPSLPAVVGVQIVVDRIEIGDNALRHNIETDFSVFYEDAIEGRVPTKNPCTGYETQLAQAFTVYLTTQADILAHPNQTPTLVPFQVTLVFQLDFYSTEDECYFRATLDKIEMGPMPFLPPIFSPLNAVPQNIQDQITGFLRQQLAPFLGRALPAGLAQLKSGFKFVNAGVSVDTAMQRIAFRIGLAAEDENADVPWSNFFHGFFADRLGGADWGLYADADMLTYTIQTLVYEQLPKDDNLQAYPGCTYSNAGGNAVLTIDVLLIYHLYKNRDVNLDLSVEADPKVAIQLSVDRPDTLNIRFDFTHLLDSDDPLVNLALDLAHTFRIPVEQMLYQLVGALALDKLKGSPLEDCKQTTLGHIECTNHIRVPQVPGTVQSTLTNLLAQQDGLSLVGTMRIVELSPAVIQTTVHEFTIGAPAVSCGVASMVLVALFEQDPTGFPVLHAYALVDNQGTAPLNLCGAPTVVTGANGPFPPNDVRTDAAQAPFRILVDIPPPDQSYYDNPYPLDLLVVTSGGVRLLRFLPPPVVTKQDYDRMTAVLLEKVGNCEQLIDPWLFHHQGYNPMWSPRPPEDGLVEHLWQVEVSGLAPGEGASLVDSQNQEIMRAVATGFPIRLSAMVKPGGETELSIVHISGMAAQAFMDPVAKPAARGIEVRQTLLLYRGSVPLSAQCQTLLATSQITGRCAIAVLDERIAAYDFGNPDRPRQVRSWRVAGVRGAVEWQNGLLVFGEDGLGWLQGASQTGAASWTCTATPVLAAVAARDALYALTDSGLDIYSRRLCWIGQLPVEGGTSVARAGGKLLVGGRRGLAVFDLANPLRPQLQRSVEDLNITALAPPLAGVPGSLIAVTEDGTTPVFRLDQGQPEEIARYRSAPWFVETVRLGDVLVKIGADRLGLDTYRFGPSAVI